jgi:hypothetical protein
MPTRPRPARVAMRLSGRRCCMDNPFWRKAKRRS